MQLKMVFRAALLVVTGFLAGCVAEPRAPTVAQLDDVDSINLFYVGDPDLRISPTVEEDIVLEAIGPFVSIFGKMAEEGIVAIRGRDFDRAVRNVLDATSAHMETSLQGKLEKRFDVTARTVDRDQVPEDDIRGWLDAAVGDADAALLFMPRHLGYVSSRSATSRAFVYAPENCGRVMAIDGRSRAILMNGFICVGPTSMDYPGVLHIQTPGGYEFRGWQALMADPDRARQGLLDAADQMTDWIALALDGA